MFRMTRWSPYIVGVLIGVLSLLTFALFHHTIGTTTTFVRLAALFWQLVDPAHLAANNYYMNYLANNAWMNWQAAFVMGIFIGAFIASRQTKQEVRPAVPEVWQETFGPSRLKRLVGAFFGGVILLFGARLAGGCTSGHVISGGMQLALSGWIFMAAFFATGVPVACILYKKRV